VVVVVVHLLRGSTVRKQFKQMICLLVTLALLQNH